MTSYERIRAAIAGFMAALSLVAVVLIHAKDPTVTMSSPDSCTPERTP